MKKKNRTLIFLIIVFFAILFLFVIALIPTMLQPLLHESRQVRMGQKITVSWSDYNYEGVLSPSILHQSSSNDPIVENNTVMGFGETVGEDKYTGLKVFNRSTNKILVKVLASRMKEIDQHRISNIYLENSVRCELVIEDSNDKKVFIVSQSNANEQIKIPKIFSPGNYHFKVIWE